MDDAGGVPSHDPVYDVGILLLHGIGLQKKGSTLSSFGGPIIRWLTEWLHGLRVTAVGSRSRAELEADYAQARSVIEGIADDTTRLRAAEALQALARATGSRSTSSGGSTPEVLTGWLHVAKEESSSSTPENASVEVSVLTAEGAVDSTKWLMAESWWADTFPVPRFRELALWALGVTPWVLVSHFLGRVVRSATEIRRMVGSRRWLGPLARLIRAIIGLVLAIPASIVLLAVLLLMLLLALPPIPRLRSTLLRVQRAMSFSLGDSFVLVDDPIHRASIIHKARSDLEWLASKSDKVVVLAHSQGAAVIHHVLREGPPDNLKSVITFGSGIKKLDELDRLQRPRSEMRGMALMTLGGALLLGVAGWRVIRFGSTALDGVLLVIVIGGVMFTAAAMVLMRDELSRPGYVRWVKALASTSTTWIDFYSDLDPVPVGALMEPRLVTGTSGMVSPRHDTPLIEDVEMSRAVSAALAAWQARATDDTVDISATFDARGPQHRLITKQPSGENELSEAFLVGLTNSNRKSSSQATATALIDISGDGQRVETWEWRFRRSANGWKVWAVIEVETYPESSAVTNYRSMVRDHTNYMSNLDEFVTAVVTRICSLVGSLASRALAPNRNWAAVASRRRAMRVGALRLAATATFLTAGAITLLNRASWESVTRWGTDSVLAGMQLVARTIGAPFDVTIEVSAVLLPTPEELRSTAGAAAILLGGYLLTRFLWSRWNHTEMIRFFDRNRYESMGILSWLTAISAGLTVGLALERGIPDLWAWAAWTSTALVFFGVLTLSLRALSLRGRH